MVEARQAQLESTLDLFSDESILGPIGTALAGVAKETDRLVLNLDDLIEDDNGEVVLFNDSHVPSVAIETDAKVIARGEMQGHVTATGEDVSGFQFMSFETGLTIYFKDEMDLILINS